MKLKPWILIPLVALALTGCTKSAPVAVPTSAPVITAYPLGSIKKGSSAVCVVCAVKEGSRQPETVSETINYKGKTYAFCNESEKAEFISNPSHYAASSGDQNPGP